MLSVIDKRMKAYFKNAFFKWKNMKEEIQEKQNNVNINFFDSCLSLNLKNNEVINNDINNINDNINNNGIKKSTNDIINNISLSNKKNEIIENINISKDKDTDKGKKNNFIKKDIIFEKSMDFEENLFPKYNDVNNNSIAMEDNNLVSPDENIKINKDNNDNNDNNVKNDNIDNNLNLNENIKDINDDFDVKLSEEMLLNSKDSLKRKSDIFDSNDLNDSLNDNINNNENDIDKCDNNNNICNLSTEKGVDNFLKKEKEKNFENNDNDPKIENNEICNFFNIEKDTKNEAQNNFKESFEKDKKDILQIIIMMK